MLFILDFVYGLSSSLVHSSLVHISSVDDMKFCGSEHFKVPTKQAHCKQCFVDSFDMKDVFLWGMLILSIEQSKRKKDCKQS